MLKKVIILLFVFLLAKGVAFGHPYGFSFEEQVLESQVILVATADDTSTTFIGWRYTSFEPETFIKGVDSPDKIVVRHGDLVHGAQENSKTFVEGKRYVIFLKKTDSYYIALGYYDLDENNRILYDYDFKSLDELIKKVETVLKNRGR